MSKYLKYQPFLKRLGNRDELSNYIMQLMPEKFNIYYEPFVGNGAMLFDLHPNQAVISDINRDLMNAYEVVENQPSELLEVLTQYYKYSKRSFYNQMRRVDHSARLANWSPLKRAARYIYLNQASYTGKWTMNLRDHCNMAFNPKSDLKLDPELIFNDAQYLKDHVSTDVRPFESIVDHANSGDFVYFNPPYIPISFELTLKTALYSGFTMKDQRKLAKVAKQLVDKGVYVMISNANVPLLHTLYPSDDFTIHSIDSIPVIDANDHLLKDVNEAVVVSNNF